MRKYIMLLVLVIGIFFNIVNNNAVIVGVRPKEARPWLITAGVLSTAIGISDWDRPSGKILTVAGLGVTICWTF